MSGDEVRRAIYYDVLYQAATRTSMRDLQNTRRKIVIVSDLGAAQYLRGSSRAPKSGEWTWR